ncbi:MAG: hypothetical protein QOJ81_1330 [Chloroflexota bacterium]|nr:hypothetical protein [Chloroflexota bacterium]
MRGDWLRPPAAFHCWHVDKHHGAAIPCEGSAIVVWRDAQGVRHGYCDTHLPEGHIEADRFSWALDGAQEAAA